MSLSKTFSCSSGYASVHSATWYIGPPHSLAWQVWARGPRTLISFTHYPPPCLPANSSICHQYHRSVQGIKPISTPWLKPRTKQTPVTHRVRHITAQRGPRITLKKNNLVSHTTPFLNHEIYTSNL